ncbi:hypothetical protein HUO09_17125 [Vibrio sp. Y2-5]|uniref:hypothetical protein n=1 Tax=Vibrio sp. Y2-5 TaxID=2743977 RepID=UPI001660AF4E|nr:hypothetical protein [Vibrio sp. Y2-5]MBD0788079.1 hypothetical protein [Vibrio sp. Y2-5]
MTPQQRYARIMMFIYALGFVYTTKAMYSDPFATKWFILNAVMVVLFTFTSLVTNKNNRYLILVMPAWIVALLLGTIAKGGALVG